MKKMNYKRTIFKTKFHTYFAFAVMMIVGSFGLAMQTQAIEYPLFIIITTPKEVQLGDTVTLTPSLQETATSTAEIITDEPITFTIGTEMFTTTTYTWIASATGTIEVEAEYEDFLATTTVSVLKEENDTAIPEVSFATTTISIRIEGVTDTILPKTDIIFRECSFDTDDETLYFYENPIVYCALLKASQEYNISIDISYGNFGMGIEEIEGEVTDWTNSPFWLYTVEDMNGFSSSIDTQVVAEGDSLVFYSSNFDFPPLSTVELSTTTFEYGTTTTIQGNYWDTDTNSYQPVASSTAFSTNDQIFVSDEQGQITSIFEPGTYTVQIVDDAYIRSEMHSFDVMTPEDTTPEEINTQDIILRIETEDETLVYTTLAMPETCEVTDTTTTTPHTFDSFNAICVLAQAKENEIISSYQVTDWGFAFAIDEIHGINNASDWSETWLVYHNNTDPGGGINTFSLTEHDELLLTYGPWPMTPLVLDVSSTTIQLGVTTTLQAIASNTTTPHSATTTFYFNNESTTSPTGIFEWVPTTTGTIDIFVEADGMTRSAPVTVTVITTPVDAVDEDENSGNNNSGGCCSTPPSDDDENYDEEIQNMIEYVYSKQVTSTGAIKDAYYSDWAALSYGALGNSAPGFEKLKNYLKTNPVLTTQACKITDYARRAMALMALDINPYSGTATNYITELVSAYTDEEIQNDCTANADIFSIFPLIKAGYTPSDEIIITATEEILVAQSDSGAIGGSIDLTAAAIQALSEVKSITGVSEAIEKAKIFLEGKQTNDGGFGNVYSTAWSLQAIYAMDDTSAEWKSNGKTPDNYLVSQQQADGSVEGPDTLRATIDAIPALLHKSWGSILSTFSKPTTDPNDSPDSNNPSSPNTPTSTPDNTPTSTDQIIDITDGEETLDDAATKTPTRKILGARITEDTKVIVSLPPVPESNNVYAEDTKQTALNEENPDDTKTETEVHADEATTVVEADPESTSESPIEPQKARYAMIIAILGIFGYLAWKKLI